MTTLLVVSGGPALAAGTDDGPDDREPTAAELGPQQGPGGDQVQAAALPAAAVPAAITSRLGTTAKSSSYLGSSLTALVVEAGGSQVWQHNASKHRMPASAQKMATALTVLHSMDDNARLTTTVQQWGQTVFLKGAGDPSLNKTRLANLARDTAAALRAQGRSTIDLRTDVTVLPKASAATGWKSSYLKSDVQAVQGLPLAGYRGKDAALETAKVFAVYLGRYQVKATLRPSARTSAGAKVVASSSSPTVGQMVSAMLAYSNNDYAEFLLRHAARARGQAATWTGAIRNEVAVLQAARIPTGGLRVYDGSGLSRSNRMPAATMAQIVRHLWNDQEDAAVVFAWGAMPRAAETGTLAGRFRTSTQSCAKGLVLAKTGTLTDAVTLTGVARGVDGRDRVFVLFENGLKNKNTKVRSAIDTLATTIVGCRL